MKRFTTNKIRKMNFNIHKTKPKRVVRLKIILLMYFRYQIHLIRLKNTVKSKSYIARE